MTKNCIQLMICKAELVKLFDNVNPVEFEVIAIDTNLTSIDFLSHPIGFIEHHTQIK